MIDKIIKLIMHILLTNNLHSVNTLHLEDNGITEIPDHAFQPQDGHQDALVDISFRGESIKKLGKNAFSAFTNLHIIVIDDTSIDYIPEDAFALKDHDIDLDVQYVGQRMPTFDKNSLNNMKGYISFYTKYEIYLDELAFKPFLDESQTNIIDVELAPLNCTDTRNAWFINDRGYKARIKGLKC